MIFKHKKKRNPFQTGLFVLFLLLSSGCSMLHESATIKSDITPLMADKELKEQELLNVAIKVFEPGTLPEEKDERNGLSEEIRLAEANFIPVHLKYSLQRTGFWGSIWVLPDDTMDADLMIHGKIDWSDGERLGLTIKAVDSRNVVWLDKSYSETCLADEQRDLQPEEKDAFQDLFNAIANDLAQYRNHLSPEEIRQIRLVTRLRFATSIAPQPFDRYLNLDAHDHYTISSLPARNDPMIKRVLAIRSRDEMLMDTFTRLYDNYYFQLWEPYQNWRKFRADELRTMHEIEHQALTRQVLGFAAILGAVALGAISDQDVARSIDPLRGILAAGGTAAVYSGYQKRKEAKMNQEVIEELGESFTSESKPFVVKVNGETVRLTGNAKEQYSKWQELLRQIYMEETGMDKGLPLIMGLDEDAKTHLDSKTAPFVKDPSTQPLDSIGRGNE